MKAAQLYLLAQHVHTGLKLLKDDIVENFPILKRIKGNLEMLRNRILDRIYAKLEVVELNSSVNLFFFEFPREYIIFIFFFFGRMRAVT